jgi:hypothetical protein
MPALDEPNWCLSAYCRGSAVHKRIGTGMYSVAALVLPIGLLALPSALAAESGLSKTPAATTRTASRRLPSKSHR